MSTDAPQAAPPEAPKKSKKSLLMILVIVAGIVVGGGGGAFMAGPLLAGGAAKGGAAKAGGDAHADDAHGEKGGEHGEQGEYTPAVVHMVENLVLNPANTGGSRFLLLSVGFAVKDEAAAKTLADRDPELRDAIIRFFGARSIDQLGDIAQRDSFKIQLRAAVGERFGAATVRDIYFPQFVIQ